MDLAGEIIAWAAVVIGTTTSIPQIVLTVRRKSVRDLSLLAQLMGFASTVLWIVYAAMDVDARMQVLVSSAIRIVLSLTQLTCYIIYSKNPGGEPAYQPPPLQAAQLIRYEPRYVRVPQ